MPSIRGLFRRGAALAAIASTLGVALASTSCGGGGGGYAAKPMVLTEFLFVDRALQPSFPTGTTNLPRNAQIIFQFSELVNPNTVNDQTIKIRYGAQFQSVPKGSLQVDGSRVIFDPTVTEQGTANPFGLDPVTQYNVQLPAQGQANQVVENLDNDPLLTPFLTNFVTSDGYLRELVPPSIVRAYFVPEANPITGKVPGNSILALEFSEPMDPASFVIAGGTTVSATDTVDVRYNDLTPDPNINSSNGVENVPIPGTFSSDPAATTWFFTPTFSFGNKQYVFSVQVLQGLTDLAGNFLVNPRSFGPYTCDGTGSSTGKILFEDFNQSNTADRDTSSPALTEADWGVKTPSVLQGVDIQPRTAQITSAQLNNQYGGGILQGIGDPLMGAKYNNFVPNVQPPTSQGRRVMWAFRDDEIGASGSVTSIAWGPDSNAIFAATYPDVILRMGFQVSNSMNLAETFSGNYAGSPLIIYRGAYQVAQGTNKTWYAWPPPTSYFDWDEGSPSAGDRVLVFDASVAEGDTWQQIRGWMGNIGGFLIPGVPYRRMYSIYESDVPNPASIPGVSQNPEPSITDTQFTITKRVSICQSKFYTPDPIDPGGVAYPGPYSTQRTFGTKSNYIAMVLNPTVQTGGAQVTVEYQGAAKLDPTGNRDKPDTAQAMTAWTTNVNDCDSYPYLRWRITLTSNLVSQKTAKLASVAIPLTQMP